jgi:hypothetical protein
MFRDEAVTVVEGRLGQRTGQSALIITEMKAAQAKLEEGELLPWFLKKIDTTSYVGSAALDAVPADFIREDEEEEAWIQVNSVWGPLKRDYYSRLAHDSDLGSGTGTPTHYALYGDTLYWFKAPDKAYSRKFFYYAQDAVLSTNIENKWLRRASGLLIADTGLRVAKILREPTYIQLLNEERREAWSSLLKANAAQGAFAQVRDN